MHVVPGQNLRCRQSLVYATSAAYNHSVIFLASAQPMSLAERKLKCIWIEHCRFSAHDSQINKFAVAFHNPFHDGEHLLRAGNINDLQVADGVKCSDVVVAHVGGAVRTCLKICCGGQECNIQSVAFTEPTIARGHRFQPLLLANGDPPQDLPIEERAECADPNIASERGKGFANQHHVGFSDSNVQCSLLVDCCHAGFKSAGGAKIRIDSVSYTHLRA